MIKPSEFHLRGGRSGVLLIHGLTGTPTEMRFVGNGLHRAGFSVLGMQLAGHCGDDADLLATGWRDWYASVVEAAQRLREEVDHLFVAGLSMGAILALELAIDRPHDVDGLGLYGTTFFHDGWATPPIGRLAFLLPLLTSLGLGRRKVSAEVEPYGIKDERIRNRVVGAMLSGDSQAAGLAGFPWPSLAEFQRLSRRVRRRLGRVRAPCFVAHSSNDDVASLRNVRAIQRGIGAPVETLLLDDSYHMVTVDRERGKLVEHSATFFRRIAEQRQPMPASIPRLATVAE
ncbi:alpha/beta hydrolase [Dokdonella fugitiva]|jgi:carboxylesterase|uniref:Carboxylesterase n=1 Tax=Dokdonella fugitiva TaxID=328517 RepID=A0A4R2HXQ3_9GAMM|nr:alpha/beta fold hydrolase [Dokdonella fugitiva]MBA8885611.1 carboxylesterase [Dokdonella fugitiva]TCO36262.1 carboxylesterase [Dokdonella fugitiva]